MNIIDYLFNYRFHPVGQGLFSSGNLHALDVNTPDFVWVYDCGTSSSHQFLKESISKFKQETPPRLNLVTISHFDKDHISGVSELLSKFAVDMLLLPYIPLWQRMIIAFEENVPSDVMPFFINPVAYLVQLPEVEIGRIIFVLPSGEAGPPKAEIDPISPEPGHEYSKIHYDESKPVDSEEAAAFSGNSKRVQVSYLPAGSAVKVNGLWEFLPYNDQELAPLVGDAFLDAVARERNALLNSNNKEMTKAALNKLKILYDSHFGRSSERRNLISLFLYGGPVYSSRAETLLNGCSRHAQCCVECDVESLFCDCCSLSCCSSRCSILYTGDGYLDSEARLNRLRGYLGIDRLQRVGAFQVMHHGAKGNWHAGIAEKINPVFSIFSSDATRKRPRHPHPHVLRDFWSYGPIQVNKPPERGTSITGWMRFEM